jgi:hypothetical protein
MNLSLLQTLHVAGVIALFSSLGAIFLGNSNHKAASVLHGISLIFILLIGFAMLKKPPMDQHWWMVKIGLWFFIGGAPVLAKRKLLPAGVVLTLCIIAATFSAWLGIAKPF